MFRKELVDASFENTIAIPSWSERKGLKSVDSLTRLNRVNGIGLVELVLDTKGTGCSWQG